MVITVIIIVEKDLHALRLFEFRMLFPSNSATEFVMCNTAEITRCEILLYIKCKIQHIYRNTTVSA